MGPTIFQTHSSACILDHSDLKNKTVKEKASTFPVAFESNPTELTLSTPILVYKAPGQLYSYIHGKLERGEERELYVCLEKDGRGTEEMQE